MSVRCLDSLLLGRSTLLQGLNLLTEEGDNQGSDQVRLMLSQNNGRYNPDSGPRFGIKP